MECGHDHKRKLDGQKDGDDDDQHQSCVVRVSLTLVLPGGGGDDDDGGGCDDAQHQNRVQFFASLRSLL